ncbi:MAG: signal transduction histidine kinase, partial [Myxococcota bacterium]
RGTGLGLAVVYGIVKEYGGRVQLSSTEGIGSRFEILLPTGEEAHP